MLPFMDLTAAAKEEDGNGIGTGMGADYGTDGIDQDIFHLYLRANQICSELGILEGIAMADKNNLFFRIHNPLLQHFHQPAKGFFPSLYLFYRNKTPFIVDMQNRLDVQNRANKGTGS